MVRNYAGLVACRVFIGFPEVIRFVLFRCDEVDGLCEIVQAAFYPGTIYLLSRLVAPKLNVIVLLTFLKLVHEKG